MGPEGKFVLFGHSMGAMISVNYTKRYPRNVHHLLLAGPAAVKEPDVERLKQLVKSSGVHRAITYLWNSGLTPTMLVRALPGRIAPLLTKWYVRTRCQGGGALDEETIDIISQYACGVVMLRGCSEQALRLCLQPVAQARSPIGPIVEKELPEYIPVDFIYGERDWMKPTYGIEVVERMKTAGRKNAEVYVLPNGVRRNAMTICRCPSLHHRCAIFISHVIRVSQVVISLVDADRLRRLHIHLAKFTQMYILLFS